MLSQPTSNYGLFISGHTRKDGQYEIGWWVPSPETGLPIKVMVTLPLQAVVTGQAC
jgi:hypothetical protein